MWEQFRQRIDDAFHCLQPLQNMLLQFAAFARPGGDKIAQRRFHQFFHFTGKRFLVFTLAAQNTGKF